MSDIGETNVIGETTDAPADHRSTVILIRRLGGAVTARQLAKHLWKFRNVHAATSLLTTMATQELGTWVTITPGAKGGRPSKVFVLFDGIGETPNAACG